MVDPAPLPPPHEDPVLIKLRSQEHGEGNKPLVLIGVGAAVCLVGSGVLGFLVGVLCWLLTESTLLGFVGWAIVFLLVHAVVGFLIDRQTRGRYYADTWSGETGDRPDESPRPAWLQLLTSIAIGPRLVVGGLQRQQNADAAEHDKILIRCDQFVRDLAACGEATAVARLVYPGETPARLDHLIDHLDDRDWVGHNSDRTKVWLASDAKSNLVRWGVIDPALA
jgi:hypothetical protein